MAPVSCFGMNREECEVVVGRWRFVSLPSGLPARYSHGGHRAERGHDESQPGRWQQPRPA